ncbi:hypothetical protein DHEL01_v202797 [Diaporthe helianthi]|uniref:J domain-containing protein n=1 Tax=Diaporthe helianthi TaxID=158607 RepID=A0A2P5I8J0_DIAHE|nr:hypothetical protein DHEL01_v202797 [Diaporthe helianthi]
MNDRVNARVRNSSRSANSSARSSAAFERDYDQHLQPHSQPCSNRYNPSLRSVGSRFSLSDQFATTRSEYDFGFDDGASLITADAEVEAGQDDTLTSTASFDGVIVTASHRESRNVLRGSELVRVARSHYELLSLAPGDEASEKDIRRAYFRLCDILRSENIPAQHQELAGRYLDQVQAAFETLVCKHSRDDYDESLLDDELEDGTLVSACDGDDGQDRRTNAQLVRVIRRQQERESTEARLNLDAQPIAALKDRRLPTRRASPAVLCLSQNSITPFPAISQFLQPRLRQIRQILAGNTPPDPVDKSKSQLYCTTATVTLTSSIVAVSELDSYLATHSDQGGCQPNFGPDASPKSQHLRLSLLRYALGLNFKLRQEFFIREAGLEEAALRRTLPDAVLEIETDGAASVTARASHVLRLGGGGGGDKGQSGQPEEPLHTEASISVTRVWPGASYKPRFGLGLHRRVGGRNGGTVFACADSGTGFLWEGLASCSFWDRSLTKPLDRVSTGTTWRRYMDYLSELPVYYSRPTLEVGYKFGSVSEESLGLRSGRAFTKPPGSGLQRLRDNICLSGPNNRGSWTVSGALTAGGVAGHVRFGRSLIPCRLRGLRLEAELSTYKSRPNSLLSRVRSLGRSETTHMQLALRGLKKIGKSRKLGLEMSVNNATSSVVLSLYFSSRNKSFAVPLVLFRDQPSPYRFLTKALMVVGFIPALALALFDLFPLLLPQADDISDTEQGRHSPEIQKYIALRRAEADDLVTVLAEPVSQLQRVQRERGNLVILSAKYGVLNERPSGTPASGPLAAGGPANAALHLGPSWTSPEEVADVTVALAALVSDDGSLYIPEGLRKSRLLGFWDPRPRRTKCLFVRYMFRGQERVKEVNGRDELRLP